MSGISVQEITVKAGSSVLLADLSVEVAPGEFLVIIGPNGAGKTTLLRAICGLTATTAGTISIFDRPLNSYSRRSLAAAMALVPQNMQMEFSFSVLETVLMGRFPFLGMFAREKEEDHELARQAMSFTGVEHLARRRLNELSGGERQMVMIARSLCQQSDILLLDEPTAALDPSRQLTIMKLMQQLCQEYRKTVVMVSHDLNLASLFGTRILLLKEGRAIQQGVPGVVLQSDILSEVYGCTMHVDTHPAVGVPRINLVP